MKFLTSNILYIIWFILYFTIAWLMLGANLYSFIIVSILYSISITIALSPIGEKLLRLIENCREIWTAEEQEYLLPIFDEVFQNAKEVNPNLNNGIKLYIMDSMHVNAVAIGSKTVAVTTGAIETFSQDELKGIIAHELGHITYGHTKALLLTVIGNFFFSVFVLAFRAILGIILFMSDAVSKSDDAGFAVWIITFLIRINLNISVFVFMYIGQVILALNSRKNEIQADTFAHEIGYGEELIASMYILQKMSMNHKPTLSERMKASHPHIAYRIANLERLQQNQLTELK